MIDLEADASKCARSVDAAGDSPNAHLITFLNRIAGAAIRFAKGSLRLREEVAAVSNKLIKGSIGGEHDDHAASFAANCQANSEALHLDGARRGPAGAGASKQEPITTCAADHQSSLGFVDDGNTACLAEDFRVHWIRRRLHMRERADRVSDP